MKTIIAGGRDYVGTVQDAIDLDRLPITEVVSGAAIGADSFGEEYAFRSGLPIRKYPANWKMYGKSAGPRRNRDMAFYADAVVLFPGGKGTESMFQIAKQLDLKIYDWRGDERRF